jgi:hypothetical protein
VDVEVAPGAEVVSELVVALVADVPAEEGPQAAARRSPNGTWRNMAHRLTFCARGVDPAPAPPAGRGC